MAGQLLIHSASPHAARVLLRNYFSDFWAGEEEGKIFVLHYKVRIILKKLCKWLLVNFSCVNHLSMHIWNLCFDNECSKCLCWIHNLWVYNICDENYSLMGCDTVLIKRASYPLVAFKLLCHHDVFFFFRKETYISPSIVLLIQLL